MPDLTLSGLTTFLFLVLGIAEIAFTANGLSTASGFVGKSTSNLRGDLHGHDLNLLPEYYEKKPSLVFLATGILTAVTGLFGFLGVFFRATGRSVCTKRRSENFSFTSAIRQNVPLTDSLFLLLNSRLQRPAP